MKILLVNDYGYHADGDENYIFDLKKGLNHE